MWRLAVMVLGCAPAMALAAGSGGAPDGGHAVLRCPLDGAAVEWPPYVPPSQTGLRFDLRPVGEGSLLLPLARCGRCGLVFDPYELDHADLDELRRAVASPRYQSARARLATRSLQALLLEGSETDVARVARAWLEAAWELEDQDEVRRLESLERALAGYRKVAASLPVPGTVPWRPLGPPPPGTGDQARTAAFLQVELLRQLGRLAEAGAALEVLTARPDFQRGLYGQLLQAEAALLARKDSSPRVIPRLSAYDPREDDADFLAAEGLAGWDRASGAFRVVDAAVASVNLEPSSLYVEVQARAPRLLNAARWHDLLDRQGQPRFTWADFLAVHQAAEAVAARHPWLAAWKALSAEHDLELQVVGTRPWSRDLEEAMAPWRHAGLPDRPAAQLLLRTGAAACATLYLDQAGRGAVMTSASGCERAGHWLDQLHFFFRREDAAPAYVLVRPDGQWERRTMPAEDPALPSPGARVP